MILYSQPGRGPPPNAFSNGPEPTTVGPTHALNGMPLAVVAGTCRITISASWGPLQAAVVLLRAADLVDFCVDKSPARGGHTVIGPVTIVVNEVGPGVRAGVL